MRDSTSLDLCRCAACGNDRCTVDLTVYLNHEKGDELDWATGERAWCSDCEENGNGGEKAIILDPNQYSARWLADKVWVATNGGLLESAT